MDPLKLIALDGDDMQVVSAHLQDALVRTGDIHWRPSEKRVVVALNRFDWEAANGQGHEFRRCQSALRFERVLSCKCRNVDSCGRKSEALNLLAVAFSETDAPGGVVTLTFSGGAALRLEVECLEAELADLGPAWGAEVCPDHSLDDRKPRPARNRVDAPAALAPLTGEPGRSRPDSAMPIRLDSQSADFAARFAALLAAKRETAEDVEQAVRGIIADVRARGDRALIELTRKFDRVDLDKVGLRVSADEIDGAAAACDRRALDALTLGARPHRGLSPAAEAADERFIDPLGVELGHRWTAIEAVGLYVPGGTAAYPSSVLMNAVPAKVAGCARLVMVVPAPDGKLAPLVLAAAKLAGVDEVYRIGGAQAVAALAYGTETIKPVAKIVGPGNAYVAAAKRLVFGTVGIDMIAGPSEVLILADKNGNPDWIAADLLAQAEHDAAAQSILITDDRALADAVEQAVDRATGDAAARRGRRRVVARLRRRHPGARRSTTRSRWSTPSRPSISRSKPPIPSGSPARSATPARSSSARTRRRRSATMSRARTTCCRPRARRASRRGSACSTS